MLLTISIPVAASSKRTLHATKLNSSQTAFMNMKMISLYSHLQHLCDAIMWTKVSEGCFHHLVESML